MVLSVLLTVITIAFVILTVFDRKKRANPKRCNIPGPKNGVPSVGNRHEHYYKLGKKYGGMFCYQLGDRDVLILNKMEEVDDLFRKRGQTFGNRFFDVPEGLDMPMGFGEVHYGARFNELRDFSVKTLNDTNLGDAGSLEEVINEEVTLFCDTIKQFYNGKPFHPYTVTSECTGNIIMSVLFRTRVGYHSPLLHDLNKASDHVALVTHHDVLFNIPTENLGKLLQDCQEGKKTIFMKTQEEVTNYMASKNTGDSNSCFLDKFYKAIKAKEESGVKTFMTVNAMQGCTFNLLSGGMDASSVLGTWFVAILTKYQSIQEKLRKEIYSKLGRDKFPTLADKYNMPYTSAFCQEVFRYTSLSPLGIAHCAAEDTTYKGYFIPKGTYLISNLWGIHHDEAIFKDPYEFRPERFINEDGEYMRSKYVNLFGIGKRTCPGKTFAQRELFLILVRIVQAFKLLPPEGVKPENMSIEGEYNGVAIYPPDFTSRFCPI